MKKFLTIILCTYGISYFSTTFASDPVVVIVNSANNQAITKDDLRNMYEDRVTTWQSGQKVSLFNLPVSSPVRGIFSNSVLGASAQAAAAQEENRKITNALRNPSKTKRERLVVSIVSRKPNAIGYVAKKSTIGKTGIRIVMILE